jgi:hypothetical protein
MYEEISIYYRPYVDAVPVPVCIRNQKSEVGSRKLVVVVNQRSYKDYIY